MADDCMISRIARSKTIIWIIIRSCTISSAVAIFSVVWAALWVTLLSTIICTHDNYQTASSWNGFSKILWKSCYGWWIMGAGASVDWESLPDIINEHQCREITGGALLKGYSMRWNLVDPLRSRNSLKLLLVVQIARRESEWWIKLFKVNYVNVLN